MKKYTFLSEAIEALKELGGQAHINKIFETIIKRNNLDFSNAQTPDATLRKTLQLNRLDHPQSQSNTFYSIYGVDSRKGWWGLIENFDFRNQSDEISDELNRLLEGSKKTITVNAYERNKNARIQCIEHHGAKCAVCGFDFGKIFGDKFIGKIHVHHITPIASIGKEYKLDPKSDLIPLCPNCHYVAHLKSKNEAYSIKELKDMISKT